MKVLIACEESGTTRDAFRSLGHDAWSCDILESASRYHLHCDIFEVIDNEWDLMIAHPPCTDLAVSGARWFPEKIADGRQAAALDFVQKLMSAPIEKIAIENPVSVISTAIRKPDQLVQPWMFGDEATKTTCLWLKNLPLLQPTNIVGKGERTKTRSGKSLPSWYNLPPSPDRARIRSKTFAGFARAMAEQWSI